ncbi:MAG: hypothetical protein NTY29_05360 [Proteobacteria bacterium]|nr:hypothetical protein [Pseudomonadota bacterium]
MAAVATTEAMGVGVTVMAVDTMEAIGVTTVMVGATMVATVVIITTGQLE